MMSKKKKKAELSPATKNRIKSTKQKRPSEKTAFFVWCVRNGTDIGVGGIANSILSTIKKRLIGCPCAERQDPGVLFCSQRLDGIES